MVQIATVERLLDHDRAEVSVPRKSACAHDCSECAGCGTTGYPVYAVAANPIHAVPGDNVVIESSTKKVMGVVALVYVLPFVCFFLGYALGAAVFHLGDMASGVVGAVFFALGLIPAFLYNRYAKKSGTLEYHIVRLF